MSIKNCLEDAFFYSVIASYRDILNSMVTGLCHVNYMNNIINHSWIRIGALGGKGPPGDENCKNDKNC